MTQSHKVQLGSIIWADVFDPISGIALGEHPALVTSGQREIDAGVDLRVVVCTTSFSYPLASGWFDIPSGPGNDERTGLPQACVVKATWPQVIPQNKFRLVSGRAPARVFKQVINWLKDKEKQTPNP